MASGHPIPVLGQLRALPNQLTLLRLTIIPFLVLAILDGRYHRAFILIVIAGVSDALDGTLARVFRQRTALGSYLDPIADKLMLSTLFLVLMHVELVPRRVTVLVFSRDFGIVVVATLLFATTGMRDFRPSVVGKANTLAQIFAVCSVVLAQTNPAAWVLWIRHTSLEATLWLTVGSGFHYLWRCGRRLSALVIIGPERSPGADSYAATSQVLEEASVAIDSGPNRKSVAAATELRQPVGR